MEAEVGSFLLGEKTSIGRRCQLHCDPVSGRQLNEAGVTLTDAFRRRRPLMLICCIFVVLTCVAAKQVLRFIWFALVKHNPRS